MPTDLPIDTYIAQQLNAFEFRQAGQLAEARQIFLTVSNLYQAGLCAALEGLPEDAIPDWEPLLHARPQHWCFHAFGLIKGTLGMAPSFLGIRLFLEMDLWACMEAGRLDYADSITYFVDPLQEIHLEAPKLLAKPWLYNGFPQRAYDLLMQGLRRLPHDPEAYFHLGYYYELLDDPKQARLMYQEALMINPNYWPAQQKIC